MSDLTLDLSPVGTISEACETSLAAAKLSPRDQAAAAMVRRYAELLDTPSLPLKYRKPLAEIAAALDGRATDALTAVVAALSEQSVTSDLGPKLLAGLTALGCTLAGRGVKGKEQPSAVDPVRAAHDEIGARRAARQHHPTA